MYKLIIDFLEIGKNKTAHWFVRCQDIFLGVFLFLGGLFLLCFGTFFLLSKQYNVGLVFGCTGAIELALYFIARRKGYYQAYSFNITVLLFTIIAFILLFTEHSLLGGILFMLYPLVISMLMGSRKGTIISVIFLITYFISSFFIHKGASATDLYFLVACFLVAILMQIVINVFLTVNDELISESKDKISGIQKESQTKNEFISQLSYQIRTPLNNIVVIGNLLNDTQLNFRQKDWMETILASANNLVNVVNLIAEKVSSTGIINTKPVNIAFNLQTVLNNTIQLFVGQSNEYNIALKLNLQTTQSFEGDPIQIKQIFLILIDSIIKNKNAEKINIIISYQIRQETDRLYDVIFEIKVSDQLDFMSKDPLDAKMLSYSISERLIAAMSGSKLSMHYENNHTTLRFTLSFKKALPSATQNITESAKEVKIPESPSQDPADNQTIDLKDANILLVEDNLINQKIVILSIQKLVKNIDVANNGQEALDKFSQAKYELILMDIQMPIMDGIMATKKIREAESQSNSMPTPIIAITANALAGDREHCLASGMNEYISKPFQVEVLVNKMKLCLPLKFDKP